MEFYSAIKKNEILPFPTHGWLGGYYIKWNKSDGERQKSDRERQKYDITYTWNLKKQTNKYNRKEADSYVETNYWLPVGRGKEVDLGVGD